MKHDSGRTAEAVLVTAVADAADAGPGYVMRTYRYGCPASADFDIVAMEQLRLANHLWNALVEIERGHEDAVAAIWATRPEVAEAQASVDAAAAEVTRITERIKAVRVRDQSTKPRREDRAELAAAKRTKKEAKARRGTLKTAALADLRPDFAKAKAERAAAIKAATRNFAARGLHWGTYNDVCRRRFPGAVSLVKEQRKRGEPAELRFHRFDGSGTLTAQVMWQSGDPITTPALLASPDGKRRGAVSLSPWTDPEHKRPRGAERHGELRVRIASGHHLTLPVVLHRMMPADAEVKEVKVTRRMIAGQSRVSVAIVCRLPAPEARTSGAVVDVDFGWASGGAGTGLRLARISSGLTPLPPPPASITELVTGGDWHEVWVPAAWRDLAGRPDSIRAHRDELFNTARDAAVAALREDVGVSRAVNESREATWRDSGRAGAPPEVTAGVVTRWRSPGKLVNLARSWPGDHPLAAELEAWRSRDRHLWEFEAHERDQVLARRRDAYRKVAAWIAGAARLIVIKELDVAAVRRKPPVEQDDSHEARGGRRNAQFAAPGELRAVIEGAAKARGVRVYYRTSEASGEL